MSKIALRSIGNIHGNPRSAQKALNDNFSRISQAIDKLSSRDGEEPNAHQVPLDMNSFRVVNNHYESACLILQPVVITAVEPPAPESNEWTITFTPPTFSQDPGPLYITFWGGTTDDENAQEFLLTGGAVVGSGSQSIIAVEADSAPPYDVPLYFWGYISGEESNDFDLLHNCPRHGSEPFLWEPPAEEFYAIFQTQQITGLPTVRRGYSAGGDLGSGGVLDDSNLPLSPNALGFYRLYTESLTAPITYVLELSGTPARPPADVFTSMTFVMEDWAYGGIWTGDDYTDFTLDFAEATSTGTAFTFGGDQSRWWRWTVPTNVAGLQSSISEFSYKVIFTP